MSNKNVCRAEQCQILYTVEVEPTLNNQPVQNYWWPFYTGLTVIRFWKVRHRRGADRAAAALWGHNYIQKRYSRDEEDRKGGKEKERGGWQTESWGNEKGSCRKISKLIYNIIIL